MDEPQALAAPAPAASAPPGGPPDGRLFYRRCGACRACAHPAWKQRCERNAALAAAAGLPSRKRRSGGVHRGVGARVFGGSFARTHQDGGFLAAGAPHGSVESPPPAAVTVYPTSWPQRPRRPKNAFMLFSEQHHRTLRAVQPAATFAEIADSTGKAWRALSAEERAPFDAAAAAALASFDASVAEFEAQCGALLAAGHAPPEQQQQLEGGGHRRRRRRRHGDDGDDITLSSDDAGTVDDGDRCGDSGDSDGGEPLVATRWEECGPCGRWVVVVQDESVPGGTACAECKAPITLTTGKPLECWVQCDDCGKWRSVGKAAMRALHAAGEDARWTCAMRHAGATCKSGADDWAAVRHRAVKAQGDRPDAADAAAGAHLRLADRFVGVQQEQHHQTQEQEQKQEQEGKLNGGDVPPEPPRPQQHRARVVLNLTSSGGVASPSGAPSHAAPHGPVGGMHGAPVGGVRPATRCEYIPGRDTLLDAHTLGAGLDAFDGRTGQLVLFTLGVPPATCRLAEPFVTAAIAAYYAGRLPDLRDGRESAGPVDVAAFLAEPKHAEAVEAALFRRKQRLAGVRAAAVAAARAAGSRPPGAEPTRTRHCELNFVVHVKHNQRAVYIGEEGDVTCHGNSIMAFNKSWKGNPIRSWSGGVKVADMPGAQPNKLVRSKLSVLLSDVEPHVVACAEALWHQFATHSAATRQVAAKHVAYLLAGSGGPGGARASTRLGQTGWNAYSFNLDYATAAHYDSKNVAGSFSALLILETGDVPFCGSFYMLPQYRMAMDVRQGCCLFHRSGDPEVGMHANSGLHRPAPSTHRVALVFYLTTISDAAVAAATQQVGASPQAAPQGRGVPARGGGEGNVPASATQPDEPPASPTAQQQQLLLQGAQEQQQEQDELLDDVMLLASPMERHSLADIMLDSGAGLDM